MSTPAAYVSSEQAGKSQAALQQRGCPSQAVQPPDQLKDVPPCFQAAQLPSGYSRWCGQQPGISGLQGKEAKGEARVWSMVSDANVYLFTIYTLVTPWIVARQGPLSVEFSRQKY